MTVQQLLPLYPPAWRARYGEEFVAMVGTDRLHVQQVVDIVSGAIDAWLSASSRRADVAAAGVQEGKTMRSLSFVCVDSKLRYSVRDALIGAIVLAIAAVVFAFVERVARQAGFVLTAQTLHIVATPAAVTLSMPFWALKGQSRRVQAAVVIVTVCFAVVISLV